MVTEALSLLFAILVNLTAVGGDGTTKKEVDVHTYITNINYVIVKRHNYYMLRISYQLF